MVNKYQEPKATKKDIALQVAAFKFAHEVLRDQGEFDQLGYKILAGFADVVGAAAERAIEGTTGLSKREVQALLSEAQTFSMILLGAIDEGNAAETDLRNFYRRKVGPTINAILRSEAMNDECNDPECPEHGKGEYGIGSMKA